MSEEDKPCPECGGETIRFRGRGIDLEFWICPRYEEPGHLSKEEIIKRRAEEAHYALPSGRWA